MRDDSEQAERMNAEPEHEPEPENERPEWATEQYLLSAYWGEHRSLGDIASEHGTYPSHVLYWMDRHDIPRRSPGRPPKNDARADGGGA